MGPFVEVFEMLMRITHNLIFETEELAEEFCNVVENHQFRFKPVPRPVRHRNVVVVDKRTYTRLDAAGLLDDSV